MIACFSLFTLQAQTTKNGTYEYPLTDTFKPGWMAEDMGVWTGFAPAGKDRYTSEGLVLTRTRTSASAFGIDDLEIDLREGVTIEFEYSMAETNGMGYPSGGGGLTFFLYDAKIKSKDFGMGYIGSALGYSYTATNGVMYSGLNGGYLGIGFDLNGDSKAIEGEGFGTYEMREGITEPRYNYAGLSVDDWGDYYTRHITLRGANQGTHQGYSLLLSKYFGGESVKDDAITMAKLDYDTGEYDFETDEDGELFNIADGGNEDNPNFQKIIVDLAPKGNEGMYITIRGIDYFDDEILLVDKFYYKHSFNTYGRNRYEYNSDINEIEYLEDYYDFDTDFPGKVKIGFAATTSNNHTQKTIIRNVKVSPIDDEEGIDLDDTEKQICVSDRIDSDGARTIIKILEDTDYDVDWDSFRFVNADGDELGEHEHADFYAKWEYDSYYEEVIMTVQYDFFNPGEDLEVYYSIDIDGVKSQPAKIIVKGIACGAIANPHIKTGDKNAPFLD